MVRNCAVGPLQETKLKVSAAKSIAAFCIPSYTRRSLASQLCRLALTLALLALPLAGTGAIRAPILMPLATEFLPLGTSLQPPPSSSFHLPSLMAAGRLVLGPLPLAACIPNRDGDGRIQNILSLGFADSRTTESPNGRSPPSN